MSKRIGLADIAKQAGVSTATVSRVLNGHAHVAEATRTAVLTAVDLLGYERPESLYTAAQGVVGVIVPELVNPAFGNYAQEIASALIRSGLTPLLGTEFAGGVSEDEYLETLSSLRASGLVFVSGRHADTTADHSRYKRLREQGIPFVTINGSDPSVHAASFVTDDAIGIELAVMHLEQMGHTRIALVTGPQRLIPSARKVEAFRRSMAKHFPEQEPLIEHSLYTPEGGSSAASRAWAAGATAVIAASDLMAVGAIRAADSLGLSVPGDVSVVGCDGSPLSVLTTPGLTTVRHPVASMCRAAVDCLREEIDGGEQEPHEFLFAPDLIVRGTTGARR